MEKNRGPLLTDDLQGMLEALPPWVRATLKLKRTKQKGVEPTVDPPPLGPGIVESSAVQEVTDERQEIIVFLDPAQLPKSRSGQIVLSNGQVADVAEIASNLPQTLVEGPPLVDGEVEQIGGAYLKREVTAPPFPNELFAKEKPDILPEKFRAAIPIETTRIDEAGTAVEPTLVTGQLSESQEQIKVGVKRTTETRRDAASFPQVLTGDVILDNLQKAIVTETVDDAPLTITPTVNTQPGSRAEDLGDGTYHKVQVEAPSVFPNEQFSAEKPDILPEKFRAAIPIERTRVDAAGTAVAPILGAGEIAESQEQIKVGIKRTTIATRSAASFPQVLDGKVILDNQLEADATETVALTPLTLTPSALLQPGSKVEDLGDGTQHKVEIVASSVFQHKIFGVEVEEALPLAFRSSVPLVTTREDLAGIAALPTLGTNDIEKIEEQLTAFIKRITARSRDLGTAPTLFLRSWESELQTQIVTELHVVPHNSSYSPGSTVVDYDEDPINDEWTLRTIHTMPGGISGGFTTYEPGEFTYPALLTGITAAVVTLADQGGLDRGEVNWQPVWRPGFSIPVQFEIVTTLHSSPPSPSTIWLLRTNDVVFKGVSFQVNLSRVVNDAFGPVGVSFSADGLYGNLSENFSVAASVPTRSAYNSAIGSYQIVASKVAPYRRVWVRRDTKLLII